MGIALTITVLTVTVTAVGAQTFPPAQFSVFGI